MSTPGLVVTSSPVSPLGQSLAALDNGACDITFTAPSRCDLRAYRGDSGAFRVSVTDLDGNPVDVSTATWDVDIRRTPDEEPALGSLTVVPVATDPSQIDVFLLPTVSAALPIGGPFAWDLEMTLGGVVQTLIAGQVTVTADVSRPDPWAPTP